MLELTDSRTCRTTALHYTSGQLRDICLAIKNVIGCQEFTAWAVRQNMARFDVAAEGKLLEIMGCSAQPIGGRA